MTASKPRITAMRGCFRTWLEGWAPHGKSLGVTARKLWRALVGVAECPVESVEKACPLGKKGKLFSI